MSILEPTVSVILATYNRVGFIGQALDSLLGQTRPPDEIVVVDDGSTDGTADYLRNHYGNRIRYLYKPNGGKPSALNFGIERVESDYIWIFDDDDIALKEALASHLKFLAEHPEFDFSYSPKYTFSGEFCLENLLAQPRPSLPDIPAYEFLVSTMESMRSLMQGMLIPLRCYHKVGCFNEIYLSAEDHEILLRLARRFSAGYMEVPTFALRLHKGVRGSGTHAHTEKDRARVWQQYRQRMFQDLRRELSLNEYLPGVSLKSELSLSQKRQALVQRFCIMARNGLYEYALTDYALWCKELVSSKPTDREASILTRATQIEDITIIPPKSFFWRLGVLTGIRLPLLKLLGRGLYWSARRELNQGRLLDACQFMVLCPVLLAGALRLRSANIITATVDDE